MIEPVVKMMRVPATPDEAFRRFTAGVNDWWPRRTHSVGKEKCRSVHWDGPAGAELYEVDDEGRRSVWGTFTSWDPPHRIGFTWHPGRTPETAQEIDITFEAHGSETLVVLTHRLFERLGEMGQATREEYDGGWEKVLARYAEATS